MRLTIKTKQVAGVTSIVGLAVLVLSGFYLSSLARIRLEESQARGELLANAIFHRAREVVGASREPGAALRTDAGLRSILESSAYSRNVIYAAIVDVAGVAMAHSDDTRVGRPVPPNGDLGALLTSGGVAQMRAIYADGGRTLDVRQPLLLGTTEFGSIRIGVSTLLIRRDLNQSLGPALATLLAALIGATVVAMLLAQLLLRPIHIIRSGLSRLGQGEFGVVVNLPQHDEFGELGDFFNTVSARLSSQQTPASPAAGESIVDRLEDAIAVLNPDGELLFANGTFRTTLPSDPLARRLDDMLPPGHPYRAAVEDTLATHESRAPLSARVSYREPNGTNGGRAPAAHEQLIATHVIEDAKHRPTAILLIARDLDYLSQVRSTLSDSRKLAAISRLSAGVAHEVKNPLNATVIHLELLKQQLCSTDLPLALEHLSVITAQMRRLDEVVQGFLKFIRPEDLKLQPVLLASLVDDVKPDLSAEAQKHGVEIDIDVPADLPIISADPGMLQQALLNLALNACQAMPHGGRLRIAAGPARGKRVEILFEDTGVGITPEHLDKIFDLYFTTKEHGTGIGLSMVYRTVQLLDGEIEVQSTPGQGTIFRVLLPRA